MLANYHTHTTFCDGKNTIEEIVLYSIDNGFNAIGFSGHSFTEFDTRYCMKDTDLYIKTVNEMKEKYKNKIQIYLGIEMDCFSKTNRSVFDYIIYSSHYFCVDEKYYPVDSGGEYFKKCLSLFNGDIVKLSEQYYSTFCEHILKENPDIIGHFDLITKFDELDKSIFLSDERYHKIAKKYLLTLMKTDSMFEVNTGAIARGLRTKPYPHENLLYELKKHGGKLVLSSDSHEVKTLDFDFGQTRKLLRDVGFEYVYALYDNEWKKDFL